MGACVTTYRQSLLAAEDFYVWWLCSCSGGILHWRMQPKEMEVKLIKSNKRMYEKVKWGKERKLEAEKEKGVHNTQHTNEYTHIKCLQRSLTAPGMSNSHTWIRMAAVRIRKIQRLQLCQLRGSRRRKVKFVIFMVTGAILAVRVANDWDLMLCRLLKSQDITLWRGGKKLMSLDETIYNPISVRVGRYAVVNSDLQYTWKGTENSGRIFAAR